MLNRIRLKFRQVALFSWAMAVVLGDVFGVVKSKVVSRLFWGRGIWYKTSFGLIVIALTLSILLTGLADRLTYTEVSAAGLNNQSSTLTNMDIIAQGGSLTAVVPVAKSETNYRVFKHTVAAGESLDSIAKQYNLKSADTIVWANSRIINPLSRTVAPGMQIDIPEIDGVLYEVRAGDTLDSILANARGADRFTVIELNSLVPPTFKLTKGQKIIIPNAELPPPALPSLLPGYFADPLSHPACAGYRFIRGMWNGHSGVDLAKGGGCPIRAVAAGTVSFVG
jgi:murein DD-endopeptidase MepM/ murein hydrolase activator NlpD